MYLARSMDEINNHVQKVQASLVVQSNVGCVWWCFNPVIIRSKLKRAINPVLLYAWRGTA